MATSWLWIVTMLALLLGLGVVVVVMIVAAVYFATRRDPRDAGDED